MKLTKKFEDLLNEHFAESIVIDERGDGHHVEILLIDAIFTEKNRLARSRYAFEKLSGFIAQVHAVTIKCYTPDEWEGKKENFSPTKYVHLKK